MCSETGKALRPQLGRVAETTVGVFFILQNRITIKASRVDRFAEPFWYQPQVLADDGSPGTIRLDCDDSQQ